MSAIFAAPRFGTRSHHVSAEQEPCCAPASSSTTPAPTAKEQLLQTGGALIAGVLFATGLVLGGMTQPAKVIGFLDFAGAWDGSLAFVMGGAVAVYLVLFRVITKRPAPLAAKRFRLPERRDIGPRLVVGSSLFGVGWGLAGYCPGPGIVSLTTGAEGLTFVLGLLLGFVIIRRRDG